MKRYYRKYKDNKIYKTLFVLVCVAMSLLLMLFCVDYLNSEYYSYEASVSATTYTPRTIAMSDSLYLSYYDSIEGVLSRHNNINISDEKFDITIICRGDIYTLQATYDLFSSISKNDKVVIFIKKGYITGIHYNTIILNNDNFIQVR